MHQPHAPFALLLLLQSLIRRPLLHCISTVYVGGPRNCPWGGSFSKRSTGRRVNGSNGSTGHILTVYVGGPHNCPWGILFRKSQQVDGSAGQNRLTGQWVTFTFTILYMIADDARLKPPRCKKHTAYDDTRLTPHHFKNHRASFARSTGKFPSDIKLVLCVTDMPYVQWEHFEGLHTFAKPILQCHSTESV